MSTAEEKDRVHLTPRGKEAPPRATARWRRWLRRTGQALLALAVLLTLGSFGYNAATAHRAAQPAGLSYVQAADVRTRFRTWGSHGSPVVLVHGAFESADIWQPTAEVLARRHRVWALDLAGYGYSDRRGPYTARHLARQLLAFLDAMHLGGAGNRPVLVGHSSGAAVVAEATIERPAAVGAVMFLDGDALDTGAGAHSPLSDLLIDPYRTTLLRLAVRSDSLIRAVYARQCGPACPPLDREGVDRWRRPLEVPGAESALWSMLKAGVVGIPSGRLARLRASDVPKAVVFGAADTVFDHHSPYRTADRIGAPPPTLIPAGRHLTMVSSPEAVAAAVQRLTARAH